MQEIAPLLVILVQFYATLGIMAIGFGMMIAGTDGATAAGKFFFTRPARAIIDWTRATLASLVTIVWTAVIGRITRWIASEIKEVAKDIRWLVTRERGWVWRR